MIEVSEGHQRSNDITSLRSLGKSQRGFTELRKEGRKEAEEITSVGRLDIKPTADTKKSGERRR